MRFQTISSVALLSAIQHVYAHLGAEESSSGFVSMNFNRLYGASPDTAVSKRSMSHIKRSENYEQVRLKNEACFYSMDLAIGSNHQNVTVLVDTGSSDLWVPGPDSSASYGVFSPKDSTSLKFNGTEFSTQYADGTTAYGEWCYDTVALGDTTVSNVTFAVVNDTDSNFGVLGLGLTGLEATYTNALSSPYQYDNFPVKLVRQGLIQANAYSLYLNKADASSGNVLFGAVDHAKYTGTLHTIPFVNTLESLGYNSVIEFHVTLDGMDLSTNDGQTTLTTSKFPVLVDSGNTFSYLPDNLLQQIASQIGATYSNEYVGYVLTCPSEDDDTVISYNFGGFNIDTPLSGSVTELGDDSNTCILMIAPSGSEFGQLGDTFLENVYASSTWTIESLSLAQAQYTDEEEIEIISSSIPGAIKAAGYSDIWSASAKNSTSGNVKRAENRASNVTQPSSPESIISTTTLSPQETTQAANTSSSVNWKSHSTSVVTSSYSSSATVSIENISSANFAGQSFKTSSMFGSVIITLVYLCNIFI
ncbi:hypothetical protein KAFR_0B06700 [Kazachstania africana CBS 2517]|uniref:Peptidase A1 domain-containing protein n=1 Tax=Kazachstania africana (strain ATCC 22294 / BCRC 22015 / CBS 2517 / CECT 1963 / NBRC 1671 / NRRL Y-8276) TaxID=1071382 RepID=H2ARG7_KAZAF|nr:hypothetical protein KAFR_0B06700 [Kazachstania africana CBS 2517]CCF56967.1 hypothetical protein KAFR_0B06700 [Kazachstania africana CBS 2517]